MSRSISSFVAKLLSSIELIATGERCEFGFFLEANLGVHQAMVFGPRSTNSTNSLERLGYHWRGVEVSATEVNTTSNAHVQNMKVLC